MRSKMDTVSKQKRSEIMSKIRSKNTKPELVVRSMLHRMGYRFRLHRRDLPGTPDIVLPKHRTVVDVRGCFWHRHRGCKTATTPASNTTFWKRKFARNVERDRSNEVKLYQLGWKPIVVWECELKEPKRLARRLKEEIDAR